MQFTRIEYAVLLAGAFVLYWALARARVLRMLVLLAASYIFYGFWDWRYLALIVGSSALDYYVGAAIANSDEERRRKRLLLVSLVGNLGLLAAFKYFNFFADSAQALLSQLGVEIARAHLDVALPVGISFYTFQSMSYTIDIYRRELQPAQNPLNFLVFVAFFPQLVAGPIVRAREFLPQLESEPAIDRGTAGRAFFLIAIGLVKKNVIADLLAVNLVDRVFDTPLRYTSLEQLMGVYGYAFQIYCDFSAYTDIAMGSALLFGLKLPQNFDSPYRAASLREFWHRWHISLSSWLRDYLYIPLGGSHKSSARTYVNLTATMLLGGLWHGADWKFVIWGALHGLGLAFTRAFQRLRPEAKPLGGVARVLAMIVTFHFVCLAWIFFRAKSFDHAWQLLGGLFTFSGGAANITPLIWTMLGLALVTHLLPDRIVDGAREILAEMPAPIQAAVLVLAVLLVRWAGTTEVVPFIYFQF
ncbi:MAG: MBOAT family protein [Myxococcales bacterium]|nr:MBOAT family protein [Myxococcales bacterium]